MQFIKDEINCCTYIPLMCIKDVQWIASPIKTETIFTEGRLYNLKFYNEDIFTDALNDKSVTAGLTDDDDYEWTIIIPIPALYKRTETEEISKIVMETINDKFFKTGRITKTTPPYFVFSDECYDRADQIPDLDDISDDEFEKMVLR